MNQREIGQDHIIHKLTSCQQHISDAEKAKEGTVEALYEARALFENLFDLSPDALILIDSHACIIRLNTAAERLFGYTKQELTGTDHGVLVPDRFKSKHESQMKAYAEKPRVRVMGIGLELHGQKKDGTVFAADIDLGPIEIGNEHCVLAVVRDATKRKRLEDELDSYRQRLEQVVVLRTAEFAKANAKLTQEIEERQRTEEGLMLRAAILDNVGEAVFLLNSRGHFVYVNEVAVRTYGYSRDEFLSMNLSQLLRPEEATLIPERLKEVLKSGQMLVTTIHVRKDKSWMPIQVLHTVTKTAHGQFIVSIIRNLADESELRVLFHSMPGALLITDTNLRLTSCAGTVPDLPVLKPGQCRGMSLSEYLKGSSFENAVLSAHASALAGSPANFSVESQKRKYSGQAAPLRGTMGSIIGTMSIMLDITDNNPKPV